jgi:uncharacterized membrane-anchored protein YhcB (DUF1043 family)
MTVFELFVVVVIGILGVRLGMWFANKQAEARAEVQSLSARIDIEGDAISRRIDEENRELWTRIGELDSRVTEFMEKEKK